MKCQVSSSLFYIRFPISDSDSSEGFVENDELCVTDLKPLKVSKTGSSIPLLSTGKNSKLFVTNNISHARPFESHHNAAPVMDILGEIAHNSSNEGKHEQEMSFFGTIIGWFENVRNSMHHPPSMYDDRFEACELDVLISDDSRGMVMLKMEVPVVLIEWYKQRWLVMYATVLCTRCEIKHFDLKHSIVIVEKGDRSKICPMNVFLSGLKKVKHGLESSNQIYRQSQLDDFSQYYAKANGHFAEYRRYIFESDLIRFQALRENKNFFFLPNIDVSIKCGLISIKNVTFITSIMPITKVDSTSDCSTASTSLNTIRNAFCNSTDSWYLVKAQSNGKDFSIIIASVLLSQINSKIAGNFTYDINYSETSMTPFLLAHVIKISEAN